MEQSKLISGVIAKLKVAYPYYFKELTDEEFVGLLSMYQEELSMYSESTLLTAVKNIIRRSKFFPTLKELLDECEGCKSHKRSLVIERMKQAGYFHNEREIEKTYHFLEEGIIPDWLLADMKKYGYEEDNLLINKETKLLEVNNA